MHGEHARLRALGVPVQDIMEAPGAPTLFMMEDPDGNAIAVVDTPAA